MLKDPKLLWPEMQALWMWSYQVILQSKLQVQLRCKFTSNLQIFPGIFASQVCRKIPSYFDLKCKFLRCEVNKFSWNRKPNWLWSINMPYQVKLKVLWGFPQPFLTVCSWRCENVRKASLPEKVWIYLSIFLISKKIESLYPCSLEEGTNVRLGSGWCWNYQNRHGWWEKLINMTLNLSL